MSFINDIRIAQDDLLEVPLLKDAPIHTKHQLHIFMEHHVFAVWDFMCLTKGATAPRGALRFCLDSSARRDSARLVNEIVLTEESDVGFGNRSLSVSF